MSLIELRIDGTLDKVSVAIQRLQSFEPQEGYFLAFSGGKDSCVLKALADMAGVKYDAHYNVTSVDPPELVRFIRDEHPDVAFDVPREEIFSEDGEYLGERAVTMWNLIPKKLFPPTHVMRYCCSVLKESNGKGRVVLTGVRWAESVKRRNNRHLVDVSPQKNGIVFNDDNTEARLMVENCYKNHRVTVNPIVDWENDDVWEFIHKYRIPYCSLYDDGYTRLGCIGCPMSHKSQKHDFERYPKYKEAYLRTFARMLEEAAERGKEYKNWKTPQDVMKWWVRDQRYEADNPQQIVMEEENE